MKKLVFGLAALIMVAGVYTFGTFNASKTISVPPAEWAAASQAARAWREFTVSQEASGAKLMAAAIDSTERAESVQFLAQLSAAALEMKLAKGSESRPQLTNWMGGYRKFLGDSPDAVYHTAQLSAEYRYEVTGNRGDAEYLGFMLYGRQVNGWNRAAANVSSEEMHFDEAGNFSILLSSAAPDDPAENWLNLESDIHMIMVRQYYHGRTGKTEANLAIRNLDEPQYQPSTDTEIAVALRTAAQFLIETVDGAIALTNMLATAPNSFDPPSSYSSDFGGVFYPTLDNEYYGGWFHLEEDEALIIEGPVPNAPYWAVSLQNRWMQSLDYKNYQVALNDHDIATENGRYRIVVSHQRPPSGNWLDTGGRKEGLISVRYQLSQDTEKPDLRLVKFSEL